MNKRHVVEYIFDKCIDNIKDLLDEEYDDNQLFNNELNFISADDNILINKSKILYLMEEGLMEGISSAMEDLIKRKELFIEKKEKK